MQTKFLTLCLGYNVSNVAGKLEQENYNEELDNLSNNILKKMVLLNSTLPELAKLIGIEYQTLRRLAYKKNNYLPNLRVLFPIADFFNVTVADLLKNPNIPQYVPVINIKDVAGYLLAGDKLNITTGYEKIFCSEYVHECAFALKINVNYMERITPIKYIFKPYAKIIVNTYILFEYEGLGNQFFRVNGISDKFIEGTGVYNNEPRRFKISQIAVLALAVKQVMDNDLI